MCFCVIACFAYEHHTFAVYLKSDGMPLGVSIMTKSAPSYAIEKYEKTAKWPFYNFTCFFIILAPVKIPLIII